MLVSKNGQYYGRQPGVGASLETKDGKRCFACLAPTSTTTVMGGREVPYCGAHTPRELTAFRKMAYAVMQRGTETRQRKLQVA